MKLQYIDTSIYYDVDIMAVLPNVLQVTGPKLIMKESGFILIDDNGNEYDYSAYSTLYRTVEGGFQYSNDGTVQVEPTKTVIVKIEWNDNEDYEKERPKSVKVEVFDDDVSIGTVTLNSKNNWTKEYDNVPESHEYSVIAPEIEHYITFIVDTTINYNYTVNSSSDEIIEEG